MRFIALGGMLMLAYACTTATDPISSDPAPSDEPEFVRTDTIDPIFPNSVVSNDLEFIRTDDQSAFSCIAFQGTKRAEMPDKRRDTLFDNGTFIFPSQLYRWHLRRPMGAF